MRVLVSISPRMYREVVALSIHRSRPDLDIRLAPPEYAAGELASFRPHLLIHTDTPSIPREAIVGLPLMLAVPRCAPVDSGTGADGLDERIGNVGLESLLRAVEGATDLIASR
jgi:hypothetical protein